MTQANQPPDPNRWLTGGSTPTASFDLIGASISGTVLDIQTRQQRDFNTGEPKYWKNGDPMWCAVISLQTTLRDAQLAEDDGIRNLYVVSPRMRDAIAVACRAAGHSDGVEKSGRLTVKYYGDGQAQGRNNPPKLYTAEYVGPDSVAANDIITAPQRFADAQPAQPGWKQPAQHEIIPPRDTPNMIDKPASRGDIRPLAEWQLTPEARAALTNAGINVDDLEAKRKALFDVGMDVGLATP